jgi:rubrerythrin
MGKTIENLKEAFSGESQANRKYLAFAEKAEKEGFAEVARLFRATAMAETVHANAHLRAMGGIGTTVENLKEAIAGETHEFTNMYPAMIDTARQEGEKNAERSFTYANKVEEVHAGLYKKALENMDAPEAVDYYVCSVCGYTCEINPPDECPVCGAKAKAFLRVD